MPASFNIERVHKWSWTLLDFVLLLLVIGVVVAALYLPFQHQVRDPVLHVTAWMGVGLMAGAFLCVLIWMIFGGWGPPMPLFFAAIGITVGILAAFVLWFRDGSPPVDRLRVETRG